MNDIEFNLPNIRPTQIIIIVGNNTAATAKAINEWLDTVRSAGFKKDRETCEAIGNAIKRNSDFLSYVETGAIEYATLSNYAQGAQRAYFYDLEWTPRAFQSTSKGGLPCLPWSKRTTSDSESKDIHIKINRPYKRNPDERRKQSDLSKTIIKSLSQTVDFMRTNAGDLTPTERSALLTLKRTLEKLKQ